MSNAPNLTGEFKGFRNRKATQVLYQSGYIDGIPHKTEASRDVFFVNFMPNSPREKDLSNSGGERELAQYHIHIQDGDYYKVSPVASWEVEINSEIKKYKAVSSDIRPERGFAKIWLTEQEPEQELLQDDLFNKARDLVLLSTPCEKVIKYNPNIDSPQGLYASINPNYHNRLIGAPLVSKEPEEQGGENYVRVKTKNRVLLDFSINFWRTGANQCSLYLMGAWARPPVKEYLLRNKISWVSAGEQQDLTALQSGRYEERSFIKLSLIAEISPTENGDLANTIEKVILNAKDFDTNQEKNIIIEQ